MVKYSVLIVLLAAINLCMGQSGYNYQPPPGGVGSGIRPGAQADTPIRPSGPTGGYPSGPATPPFGGYPGAFPSRPQADTPTGPGFPAPGGFPATNPIGSGTRPGLPGRPSGGFPGTGIGRPGGQFPIGGNGIGTGTSNDGSYEGGDYSAIPGQPGVDYPIYTVIPQTSFDCNQQQYPGYYADVETQCQVFHICALNRTYDFLCPNGTIFSQETLVCVWWNQFDCGSAPALYPNNAFIYDYSQTGQQNSQQGGAPSFPGTTPVGTPRPPSTTFPQRPSGTTGGFPGTGRPTGPSSGYPQGPTSAYPGPQGPTGPGSFPGTGFPSTGSPTGPTFPSGPGGPTGPGFGTTIRPSGGFTTVQADAPYPGTISPPSPNREYLPPRRS